jgi:hypothetical protein
MKHVCCICHENMHLLLQKHAPSAHGNSAGFLHVYSSHRNNESDEYILEYSERETSSVRSRHSRLKMPWRKNSYGMHKSF